LRLVTGFVTASGRWHAQRMVLSLGADEARALETEIAAPGSGL